MVGYALAVVIFLMASLPFWGLPQSYDSVIVSLLSLALMAIFVYLIYKHQNLLDTNPKRKKKAVAAPDSAPRQEKPTQVSEPQRHVMKMAHPKNKSAINTSKSIHQREPQQPTNTSL